MNRRKVKKDRDKFIAQLAKEVSMDFLSDKSLPSRVDKFIPSGSTLLDLALGGGWAAGRICNIIGDESTGKSLLMGEAIAQLQKTLGGVGIINDAEQTFDAARAKTYGVNIDEVLVDSTDTVEEFQESVEKTIKALMDSGEEKMVLYGLDSLDVLSSKAELKRKAGDATFGGEKPKMMSEFFRRLQKNIAKTGMVLMIISQVRARIGVTFGQRWTVSGGKALAFSSSQRVILSERGKIKINDRIIGIKIVAKIIKNKVDIPFEEISFPVLFSLGLDDLTSCIDWLKEHTDYFGAIEGWYKHEGRKFRKYKLIEIIEEGDLEERIKEKVKEVWKIQADESEIKRKKK